MLDRIDIQLAVDSISLQDLQKLSPCGESSETIRDRVIMARKLQVARQGKLNSALGNAETAAHCGLCSEGKKLLGISFEKFNLSARGYHRILRLARTVADLKSEDNAGVEHLSLAIKLRGFVRGLARA